MWPMFEKCFLLFEHEGVLYELLAIQIIKRTKKIFDLKGKIYLRGVVIWDWVPYAERQDQIDVSVDIND